MTKNNKISYKTIMHNSSLDNFFEKKSDDKDKK